MIRNGNALMRRVFRLEDECDCPFDEPFGSASNDRASQPASFQKCPAAASCNGQDLIPHKVDANPLGLWLVEEKCRSCLNDVASQFFPRVALREYILRQTFRAITAIGVLDGLKNQISHMRS